MLNFHSKQSELFVFNEQDDICFPNLWTFQLKFLQIYGPWLILSTNYFKQMQFGKLISNVKLLWVMKNVRQFSDKQLYQLCIGRASLQLSLFRPNTNTQRQVQFICNFLFFPVICSRWECNLLCILTACVQHALVFCSKFRQKAKSFILAAAVPAL